MDHTHVVQTPIGPLRLTATADGALSAVAFANADEGRGDARPSDALLRVADVLTAYLAGEAAIAPGQIACAHAGTPFQRRVWEQVAAIPVGETRSYLELATALGDPRRARAVGAANAANPWPIVVPCHRVVTSSGAIGGYLGGVRRKRWLLDLDRRIAGRPTQPSLFADDRQ